MEGIEEKKETVGLGGFAENEMFNTERMIDQEEQEREMDLLQYDGIEKKAVEEEQEQEEMQKQKLEQEQ